MRLTKFVSKNINFSSQLFEGDKISSNYVKLESNLKNKTYFQWLQLKYAILNQWKTSTELNFVKVSDLLVQDHHLIKDARI